MDRLRMVLRARLTRAPFLDRFLPPPALESAGNGMAKTSRLRARMVAARFAALATLLGGSMLGSAPAGVVHAAPSVTFVVNSTLDLPDANPGDGVCATAPRPQAVCTLRAAIMAADQAAGSVFSILITLPAGTYTLTIPNLKGVESFANPAIGDLDITTSIPLTIRGDPRRPEATSSTAMVRC